MKRYFKITGRFEEMYDAYIEDSNKVNEAYLIVKGLFGWEAHEYIPLKGKLAISPTPSDRKNFSTQLRKDEMGNGCVWFKVNSPVGKYWIQQSENIRFVSKPVIAWYLSGDNISSGKSRQNLFKVDGILYGSLEKEFDFEVNDEGFEEIKASDFHKVIEEYNERVQNER